MFGRFGVEQLAIFENKPAANISFRHFYLDLDGE